MAEFKNVVMEFIRLFMLGARGIVRLGTTLSMGSNAITTTTYSISEQTSVIQATPAIRLTPTSGNNRALYEMLPSGTGADTEIDLFQSSDTATSIFAYMAANSGGVVFGGDKRNAVSPPDVFINTQNKFWTFTDSTGHLTLPASGNLILSAGNISTDTTTGTKIGTAASQKIGFYNATPVAQQTGVAVTAAAIHAALVNLGLITA